MWDMQMGRNLTVKNKFSTNLESEAQCMAYILAR